MGLNFGVRKGRNEDRAREEGSRAYIAEALESARRVAAGYGEALRKLEAENLMFQTRADEADQALLAAMRERVEHNTSLFQISLDEVPAYSRRRVDLEALVEDLKVCLNHYSQVAREMAARVASMKRQIEQAERAVQVHGAELAEHKKRHR